MFPTIHVTGFSNGKYICLEHISLLIVFCAKQLFEMTVVAEIDLRDLHEIFPCDECGVFMLLWLQIDDDVYSFRNLSSCPHSTASSKALKSYKAKQ